MIAPTIVYDLDGTLADTAEDLMAALNAVLGSQGLVLAPVENARSMIGAGARVMIQRGFSAASGRTLDPHKLEVLFGDFLAHYNAHIAVLHAALSRRRIRARGCSRAWAGVQAGLHQQGGRLGEAAHWERLGIAERFAFICGQDTFGAAKPDPKPLLMTIAASGGASKSRDHGRGFGRPTSRPPAPPACPSSRSTSATPTHPLPSSARTG